MKRFIIALLFSSLFFVSCTKQLYNREYNKTDITLEKKGFNYVLITNEYTSTEKKSSTRCVVNVKSEEYATTLVNKLEVFEPYFYRYLSNTYKESDFAKISEPKKYTKDNVTVIEYTFDINK